jgi:hypothetical protein
MKLEKKHCIIIGVVVAIILVWYFFLRKKKTESGYRVSGAERHPWCPPGTTWRSACACCLPDNPSEKLKWPPWLKIGIKRVCPQGFVLDPVTKGCVRAYDL